MAEEALAIALYCALKEKEFKKALIRAVNHDGDSDSTRSIYGNIYLIILTLIRRVDSWNKRRKYIR
ncbi:ADP-ribosylglycohydrolase family protein [Anaeromonas frigoriresistens]|uniref:ADP-ribosylglycohydrolase family protein n=1 Tax=Anaeromonas frigoriresistens TaxID=2683708 RepID=UPI003315CB0B